MNNTSTIERPELTLGSNDVRSGRLSRFAKRFNIGQNDRFRKLVNNRDMYISRVKRQRSKFT